MRIVKALFQKVGRGREGEREREREREREEGDQDRALPRLEQNSKM
jgi:hypothetical protein